MQKLIEVLYLSIFYSWNRPPTKKIKIVAKINARKVFPLPALQLESWLFKVHLIQKREKEILPV